MKLAVGLAAALVAWSSGQATAAPLTILDAHHANLYGGRMAYARTCVDLRLKHPQRLVLTVAAARQTGNYTPDADGSWHHPLTLHLRAGHRSFCLDFTGLRYWRLLPRVQLAWGALQFNAVSARLQIGHRTYRQLAELEAPYPTTERTLP